MNWDPGSFLCIPGGQEVGKGEDLTTALARSGALRAFTVASMKSWQDVRGFTFKNFYGKEAKLGAN